MRVMGSRFIAVLAITAGVIFSHAGIAADNSAMLKPGTRLAIVGDSITEQKLYSRFMELYLTVCQPQLNLSICQFGWGGERANDFYSRMKNDMLEFNPDVVTTCYGMNDGSYCAYRAEIGKTYEKWMTLIVKDLKAANAIVVVGSPGAVDSKYFNRNQIHAGVYNENLAQLKAIDQKIASAFGMPFANVHDSMVETMTRAKAGLGEDYDVCGRDGIHPGANGHLVMAYAFLKALQMDGEIGSIQIDMNGKGSASNAHEVVASSAGMIELSSTRYPFCFSGDEKSSSGTRSILPFLPFNAELNRMTLVVKNLSTKQANVSWGETTKLFSRADLEKGINLANEFINNPFSQPFAVIDAAVVAKQNFETVMIKQQISGYPALLNAFKSDGEMVAHLTAMRPLLWKRQRQLADEVRAAFKPVRHRLVVSPVGN